MKKQTKRLIQQIKERASNISSLSPLYNSCKLAEKELIYPMRIAISGETKTGKSTLLNAFMGISIVPTAVEVMTYNINWFHHISQSPNQKECFIVHYINGNSETRPLEEIALFVGYDEDKTELINSIDWVDAYVNQPLLEKFDLIDTPGLDSLLGTDSKHTQDLLTTNANRPDAIIYLVNKEFKKGDIKAVGDFNKATGLLSGINSVAALTRIDEMNGYHDAAINNIENAKQNVQLRYNFADIYSIAALPAIAAHSLTDVEITSLHELANEPNVKTLISTQPYFKSSNWKFFDLRNSLLHKLSIKGIKLVTSYFQQNPNATITDCRNYLHDFSHIEQLKQSIINRFGERADFHKSNRVLAELRKTCNTLSKNKQLVSTDKKLLQQVQLLIQQFEIELHRTYAEYYLLSDYYSQETYFEEDEWERIKRLLGEGGRSIYDRLELSLNATDDDIEEAYSQELEYWQNKLRRAKVLENPRVQQQTEIILNVLQNLLDK